MALKKNGYFAQSLWRAFSMVALALVFSTAIHTAALATAQTTPCDPMYMNALQAKAFMEAQREISQNKNFIYKPDSVLAYTCFTQFLNQVSNDQNWPPDNAPFDETQRWGPVLNQMPGALNTTLGGLFTKSKLLNQYLTKNFATKYLDGRGATPITAYGNNSSDTTVSQGSYTCNQMAQVWDVARCQNFFDKPTQDGFFDFPWYVSNDPRQPVANIQTTVCKAGIMANDINTAFNGADKVPMYTDTASTYSSGATGTAYKTDPVVTHLDKILPIGVTPAPSSCSGVTPIPTGVCVVREGITPYPDAVCPNPGCHYQVTTSASSTPTTGVVTCSSTPAGTCQ